MKKKICSMIIAASLFISGSLTVRAAEAGSGGTVEAEDSFRVTFTENGQLEGNFDADVAGVTVSAMQPGDTAVFRVTLENQRNENTDWYMKNTIVRSMEENSQAAGGAYSYKLTYIPEQGEKTVLYDSRALGGDNNQGLHQADDALEDFFYLGELEKGGGGEVLLEVGLDGETQGNSYQRQLANLNMNFAVELREQGNPGGGGSESRVIRRKIVNNEVVYVNEKGEPVSREEAERIMATAARTRIVKTGDDMELFPYVLAACISGSLLMLYGIGILRKGKKEENGKGGAA